MHAPSNHNPRVVHCKREPADVYIGRPGPYGNPFHLESEGDRAQVLREYRVWIAGCPDFRRIIRRELAGKSLGCWCAPLACHGDVLVEIANDPAQPSNDPVLVFGSNLAAKHGAGSARFAESHRGASRSVANGISGRSYAIPTKDDKIRTLPVSAIQPYVDQFLAVARSTPDEHFDVTAIGCGLAGHTPQEMAALFEHAPSNCRLPQVWRKLLGRQSPPQVIVAGSRGFGDYALMRSKLDRLLADLDVREGRAEIVSGGAQGADQLGERYAVETDRRFVRVPAEWDRYGKSAGAIRNQHMSFLATHLVAFWDGSSRGTQQMIEIAQHDGLATRVVAD